MSEYTAVVDANVILRHLLHDHSDLSPKATAAFRAMDEGLVRLICDSVTVGEVVWVLTSFYRMERTSIVDSLLPILKAPHLQMRDKERYIRALELFRGPVPHFGDACCCAAALEETEGRLLSFDRRLSHAPGVSRLEEIP